MTDNKRDKQGRFKKGKSGNPAGRPRTELAELRGQLSEHAPDLLNKVIELALAGDDGALKICLDRICPPLKARSAPVNIPLASDAGLGDMARAFIQAASEGHITPDDASQMLSALAGASRVIEVSELEERISRLEEQHND